MPFLQSPRASGQEVPHGEGHASNAEEFCVDNEHYHIKSASAMLWRGPGCSDHSDMLEKLGILETPR
jgi:hypothetical protein